MAVYDFDPMGHKTPLADLDALVELGERCKYPGDPTALEVGTWAGTTAIALLEVFEDVFCVDTWEGNYWEGVRGRARARKYPPRVAFQTFCRNMGHELSWRVHPCVGRSSTWAAIWYRRLDLVFLDADHRYESVKADILAWMPHVRPGGILVLHDYDVFDGVTRAVQELLPGFKTAGSCLAYIEKGEGDE